MLTAGDFIPAGVVCVLRAVFLTYAWILLVRRHLKDRRKYDSHKTKCTACLHFESCHRGSVDIIFECSLLQEVSEMVNRPRLQTILSIMTAHPFSPRVEVPVSQRPPPPSFD